MGTIFAIVIPAFAALVIAGVEADRQGAKRNGDTVQGFGTTLSMLLRGLFPIGLEGKPLSEAEPIYATSKVAWTLVLAVTAYAGAIIKLV